MKKDDLEPTDQDLLIERIEALIAPMGYGVVHLEILNQRQKVLRLFIDRLSSHPNGTSAIGPAIGIEDCVNVARTLNEPLDQMPEIERIFRGGSYELEVSSPGVDRPLRTPAEYDRFAGKEARIYVYRPLTREELENGSYQAKNPKQKNFLGTLKGFKNGKVLLSTNQAEGITIPLSLISKANLEPKFEISNERESK